jgi:hypothetical protein
VALLESDRLGGQRAVLLALLRAMVGHGETQARRGADGVLVVEPQTVRQDSVFIFAYVFTWIPYIRNLIINRRAARAQSDCSSCGATVPAGAKFCSQCGVKLGSAGPVNLPANP